MNFVQAIGSGFRNYITFSGRAARSEYWYWALFVLLASVVAGVLDLASFPYSTISPFGAIVTIVTFLPGLAVAARRMHDLDRTAWWLLILLTGIGAIILLIWFCFKGTAGPNRFGPDPLASRA
jgi:uncharacterized membrane protein YhaH (DUF805 family)